MASPDAAGSRGRSGRAPGCIGATVASAATGSATTVTPDADGVAMRQPRQNGLSLIDRGPRRAPSTGRRPARARHRALCARRARSAPCRQHPTNDRRASIDRSGIGGMARRALGGPGRSRRPQPRFRRNGESECGLRRAAVPRRGRSLRLVRRGSALRRPGPASPALWPARIPDRGLWGAVSRRCAPNACARAP